MNARPNRKALILLSTSGLLALSACDDTAFNTTHKLAFNTTAGAITVDGDTGETAWNDGFDFHMEDGAPQAAAKMRGVATASDIYLAFTANDRTCDEDTDAGCVLENNPLFAHNDTIVVAFNVDGSNTGYRRLHIQPCFDEAVGSPSNKCSVNGATVNRPAKITYWTGSFDGTNFIWTLAGNNKVQNGVLDQNGLIANLTARTSAQIVASGATPSAGSWQTELRIPRASFPLPTTGNFGLFVDVISADSSLGGNATQYSWPTTQQIGAADGLSPTASVEATLAPGKWGVGTLDATGISTGVQLVGFGSNQTDQSLIDLGDTDPATNDRNEFHATITNAAASSGSQPGATNVVATFQIANWGLSNVWTNIPVDDTTTGSNPTAGISIAARQYRTVYSGGWTLTPTQRANFSPPNQHQCVMVLLTGSGVVINEPVRQFNMDFAVVNSPFEKEAQINLRGGKEFEGARRVILNEEFVNVPDGIGWKSRFANAEQLGVTQWAMKEAAGKLGFSILADDKLQLPLQNVAFTANNALKGTAIPVRPGQLISLIIDGGFSNGERWISPYGISGQKPRGEAMSGPGQVLTAEQLAKAPFPEGALVGSFDAFRTSFMIGSNASLMVPARAKELQVMLSGKPEAAQRGANGGFNIGVIATAIEPYMVRTYPFLAMKRDRNDYLLPFGVNLPTYVVRGSVDTGKKIRIGNKVYNSLTPAGSFGSYIRAVRQGQGPWTVGTIGVNVNDIRAVRPDVTGGATTIKKQGDGS